MRDEEAILIELYETIERYTETKNLIQNLMKGFVSYFGEQNYEGELFLEIQLLIEYSAFDIQNFKEGLSEVFHHILLSKESNFKFERNFCLEKKHLTTISKKIKKALEDSLFLYQHEFLLELTGFLNNNNNIKLSEELKAITTEYFSNNLTYFYECIDKCSEEIGFLIEDTLSDYEVFLWNVRKLLIENTKNKCMIDEKHKKDEKRYVDKILTIRDTFINTTDNLITDLLKDVNYIILISFSEKMRQGLLVGLKEKYYYYDKVLREHLQIQIAFEHKNKSIPIFYSINSSELEIELYKMCRELFLAQYNYLHKMLNYSKIQFDTLSSKVEYKLNAIFEDEFQIPICFINCFEDFIDICNIYKEKLPIILHNFIITTYNDFKIEYYDSIMKKLKERKFSLEHNYCYKLILHSITYVNIINTTTKIKLFKKLEELFKTYDNEEILKDNSIPIILNLYDLDDKAPIVFLRDNILNCEEYQNIFLVSKYDGTLLDSKKEVLSNEIVKFKRKLWNTLYNDLILYFDSILPNIGRNLDYVKKQADYYNYKVGEYSIQH